MACLQTQSLSKIGPGFSPEADNLILEIIQEDKAPRIYKNDLPENSQVSIAKLTARRKSRVWIFSKGQFHQ